MALPLRRVGRACFRALLILMALGALAWLVEYRDSSISNLFNGLDADDVIMRQGESQRRSTKARPSSSEGDATEEGTDDEGGDEAAGADEVFVAADGSLNSTAVPGISPKGQGLFGIRWQSVENFRSWLIQREVAYGGRVGKVRCRRSGARLGHKGKALCAGGDRMGHGRKKQNYGICYAEVLNAFSELWEVGWKELGADGWEAVELGVLKGSGVAIWSEVFPRTRLHAYDRYLDNMKDNMGFLRSQGAFAKSEPVMHELEQSTELGDYPSLEAVMRKRSTKFFFIIDDASHHPGLTGITTQWMSPKMDNRGAYVVEDIHPMYRAGFARNLDKSLDMWICPHVPDFWLLTKKEPRSPEVSRILAKLNFTLYH